MIKKLLLLLLLPLFVFALPFHTKEQINKISASVVKIYTASAKPDYYRPWQKKGNKLSSGTGVILDKHLILTAAHVVDNGTFIQVKKGKEAKKYIAKVKWIAHEADLALLEIEDKHFFEDVSIPDFGTLPYRQDGVVVYGYPIGGAEISTTKGIVSRIEQQSYTHSGMDHLIIQIDAPINPGNSGGPAFNAEGKVVGIAIQSLNSADGIGYLVPVEVIQHFFTDIKDGVYDGYPDDGIVIQNLENKYLREYYKMGKRDGVLVTHITKNSSSSGYIQKGDVLLEADDINIAGNNTIKLTGNGRVSANYLVRSHQIGDSMKIKILREGKEVDVTFPLKGLVSRVPMQFEKKPQYYIIAGMVFMPLTMNYLQNWGSKWYSKAPLDLIYMTFNESKIDEDIDELVVMSNLLPNNENANYNLSRNVVRKVNGEKVISLNSFVNSIEKSQEEYMKIELDGGITLILNKEKALKSDIETMKKYGITEKQRLE